MARCFATANQSPVGRRPFCETEAQKDNSPLGHQSRKIEGLVYFAQARCLLLVITRLASDSDCRDAAGVPQAKASSRMEEKLHATQVWKTVSWHSVRSAWRNLAFASKKIEGVK
jgi:hypothetical protein